jgi:transcriptional regulator GlxA family with amidase domain
MNESVSRASRRPHAQEAVALAEAYLRAHIDALVPVSLLSRLVGLSERGLRDAFYRVKGIGPKRWIAAERLQAVRNALSDQGGAPTTVTDAAADYGFYELGRFAGIYRAAFGEAPSDTLRSTNQKTGATPRRTRTRQCLGQHVRYPAPLVIRSNDRPSTRRGTPV